MVILGDFNAKVGRDDTDSNDEQPPRGPTGELPDPQTHTRSTSCRGTIHNNYAGTLLMNTCNEQDMYFLTGRTHTQTPTCRNSTIVEHVLGSRALLTSAHTVTHVPSTDIDVQCCGPVIITIPMKTPHQKPPSTARLSWRLDNLQQPEFLTAYLAELGDRSAYLTTPNATPCTPLQSRRPA